MATETNLGEWKDIVGRLGAQVVDSIEDGNVLLRLTGGEYSFTFVALKESLFGVTYVADRIDFLTTVPQRDGENRFETLARELQKTIGEAAAAIAEATKRVVAEGEGKPKSEAERIKREIHRKIANKVAVVDAVNEVLAPLRARYDRLPEGQEKADLEVFIMNIREDLLP